MRITIIMTQGKIESWINFINNLDTDEFKRREMEIFSQKFPHRFNFNLFLDELNPFFVDPKNIRLFNDVFEKYNSISLPLDQTKELVKKSIKEKTKYGQQTKFIIFYSTSSNPDIVLLNKNEKREEKMLEVNDCGHLDLINALLELQKEDLISIVNFEILNDIEGSFLDTSLDVEQYGETDFVLKITFVFNPKIKTSQNDKKIYSVFCVEPKNNGDKFKIIINEDYGNPIEVNKNKRDGSWDLFYRMVVKKEELRVGSIKSAEDFLDYLNTNKGCKIYKKTSFELTKILGTSNSVIVPLIKIEPITEKTFKTRLNKG